jgi:hypothetical protein
MAKKEKIVKTDSDSSTSELVRKFRANPAVFIGTVIVLVLVIVSFVFVPAMGSGGGTVGTLTFGYYDKVPVTFVPGNFFSQRYDSLIRYFQSQGVDVSSPGNSAAIFEQAYNTAVLHTAILQEMKKSNYTVPEKTVNREVAQLPQFQENGRFSPTLYRQMPDTRRIIIWRQMQDDIIKALYTEDLAALLIPEGEAEFIVKAFSNMRSFEAVSFLVDDFPASEYLAYARENESIFSSIHLSRIVVNSSEREAKKILASVKDGTSTFEDAARAQSQDSYADRGGDMGVRYVFDLDREITDQDDREKILSLGRGELSDVIKMDTRWAFYRVEDELAPANFDDEAVMERVRAYMRNFQRGRMEDWAIAQADEFINDALNSSFENAVGWSGRERRSFGPLPLNFGNVDFFTTLESFSIPGLTSQEISDLSRNENFWKIAFSTPLNTPSQPFVQGSKVLVLYPVEDVELDEDKRQELIMRYNYYWVASVTEQTLQPYFKDSKKMKDNFWETYYSYFYGN